jgi:hypothetical protein
MRISTTTLESFRLFMQPEQEWMSEDELLANIRGEFVGNHKVWLGMAFGAVLEHPAQYRVDGGFRVEHLRGCPESFAFGDDVMEPVFKLMADGTVFEAKAIKRYGRHDVVAKADQMIGAHLIETKTTLGYFDFDKYADSYQWRFMADIFEPSKITYHVFCLDESEQNGVISLRGIESFDLYPYAACHTDCLHLVRDFETYVTEKGLVALLDARQQAA